MRKLSIAIDGPAGAGKSTIAKNIAKALGIIYLDTGAMYRTVALKAIHEGIDTGNREKLSQLVGNIDIRVTNDGMEQRVFLDGQDVTDRIRTPEVSAASSKVAAIPEVRVKMVELQRAIAAENNIIMDGRDIGTYVLPNADLKIFLTATVEERAKRRYSELAVKDRSVTLEKVKEDIEIRDRNDSTRSFAPLAKADDAVELDSSSMTAEEVTAKVIAMMEEKLWIK